MLPAIYKPATLHALHGMHADPVGISFHTPDGIVRFSLERSEAVRIADLLSRYLDPSCDFSLNGQRLKIAQPDRSSGMPSTDVSPQEGQ